jgi:hypothetical protein
MSKRKIVSVAFTGTAAAAATVLAAPAAFATTGWHIHSNGGKAIASNKNYSASNSTPATLSAATTLTCPAGTAIGSGAFFKSPVATTSGNDEVGTVSVANFGTTSKPCTFANLVNFTAKLSPPTGAGLELIAKSYKSTADKVVLGKLVGKSGGNIHAKITGTTGCSATISGPSVPISYNNSTHHLTFNPPTKVKTLTITKNNGCPGIASNSKAGFAATYHLNTPTSLSKATLTNP